MHPSNRLRSLSAGCIVAYVIGFLLWRMLVASPLYDRFVVLRVSEILGVWAFLPLPFLLAAALWWRSRWLLVGLLVPLLSFGREYGQVWLPTVDGLPGTTVAHAHGEDATLRVMSFNTLYLYSEHEAWVKAIGEVQPDLIALQETNPLLFRRLDVLDEEYPYRVYEIVRMTGRVAILSRFPILSVNADDAWFGCHCVQAVIDWHGNQVRVIVVHVRAPSFGPRMEGQPPALGKFDDSHQAASYDALLTLIAAANEPTIVVGDFNTTERQVGYGRLVAAGLENAHAEAGWGFGLTYPAPFSRIGWLPVALLRIDHVFYDAHWEAIHSETRALKGSDHLALIADLRWVGVE